jgi:hypothetical protein
LQEAYKAIEDIHGLMNLSKKPPVPKTMANYYQKLAMVFWKAGNYLFHAAALFKLFQLSKEMKKNITPEELQRSACEVYMKTTIFRNIRNDRKVNFFPIKYNSKYLTDEKLTVVVL